jgi:methionyl-tRNA formyltransferase
MARVVWVSFDVVGRECLLAAADAGAEVVGVVTLPGPVRPEVSGMCAFDEVADRLGAELIRTDDVNAAATVDAVAALRPELVFVVGWSQLVRDPFITTAARGVYGMHPTLLPRHRGRAPIPWAIILGLASTGVTLFQITDPTADSGPIVGQVEVPIAPDETATTLYERVNDAHLELVRRFVPALLDGTAPHVPQDARRASAWPRRTPADGIVDWTTRAPFLDAWVRAQTRPYPGAFTWLGDERVVLWRGRALAEPGREPVGTVVGHAPGGVVVRCGDGALLLEEVGMGDAVLTGDELARRLPVGTVLG